MDQRSLRNDHFHLWVEAAECPRRPIPVTAGRAVSWVRGPGDSSAWPEPLILPLCRIVAYRTDSPFAPLARLSSARLFRVDPSDRAVVLTVSRAGRPAGMFARAVVTR